MHLADLDYDLPEHLIAQHPLPQRDESRLLVLRRAGGALSHHRFHELPELLGPGDLLVLNETRVRPARLIGRRAGTGGKWEGLFLQEAADGEWELLCQTRGRLAAGEELLVGPPEGTPPGLAPLRLRLVSKTPMGRWLARPSEPAPAEELLARYGQVPIPPYIRKGRAGAEDQERYQTVYARRDGAVAAPTAGLHFSSRTFADLQKRHVSHAFVTLHVGPGTFQPIHAEDLAQHRVEAERGELPPATAQAIAACKARGGRVVAVGTTTVRVLETAALPRGTSEPGPSSFPILPWEGSTDLTIAPPFAFRAVDALLTNFHLPRSSLLLLVAAFAGLETVRAAYRTAVEHGYRFYSYGDAMLTL
jgi:S-adenosylmethionine:tRNA ribosyltransferase-isomerase